SKEEIQVNDRAGGTRPAIAMWPDDTVTFTVPATGDRPCELAFAFGAAENDVAKFHGELKLRVLVDQRPVHEQTIHPGDDPADRTFYDVRVQLPARGGERTIAFECTKSPADAPMVRVGIAGARLLTFDRMPARSALDAGRNVVLILIDTVRWDH